MSRSDTFQSSRGEPPWPSGFVQFILCAVLSVPLRESSVYSRTTHKILSNRGKSSPLLVAKGGPYGPGLIGDIDTLIAATALERHLTVVTIDTDFQRVPSLRVILLSRATMQVLSTP